ncbi:sigma 54-interacting transcriptional regulator [Cellulomonas sp.]|uniref:sigma 54-interacting transcriptional regulator n=1 Tax=Cellulomonas sp. TaxID=40001 RepID=UPI003BAA90D7
MAWFRLASSPRSAPLRARLLAAGLRDADARTPEASTEGAPGVVVLAEASTLGGPVWPADASGRVLVAALPGVRVDPWGLLARGAADVVHLDGDDDLAPVLDRLTRWEAVDRLVTSGEVTATSVGTSTRWRDFLRELVEVARFSRSPVLLTGETGVGKEVAARLVHRLDPRRSGGDLVLIDCTTVVPTLAGSEFFGHERGAFTGATAAHEGAFARADGGTLFLDEVGELPTGLQAALLRVVQEGTYQTVGGTHRRRTDFRLVAATHRDLQADGFRADLYHRLAASHLHVPPLRARREDVVPLFRYFLAEQCADGRAPDVVPEVAAALEEREFPGNVRELRQVAARVAARHVGEGPVTPGDLPPEDRPVGSTDDSPGPADRWERGLEGAVRDALRAGVGLKELKARTADVATRAALDIAGGSGAAAHLLGVSRRALDYRTAALERDHAARSTDPSSEASS